MFNRDCQEGNAEQAFNEYWIGIYGIRNLTKEINIRISWQTYPKEEDTKK